MLADVPRVEVGRKPDFEQLPPAKPQARVEVPSSRPKTEIQILDVPRFFLHQQDLDSPIHLSLQLEVPEGRPMAESAVTRFAQRFVKEYPDKDAWWEIVNNDLVAALLQRYPQVEAVKSKFQVGSSDQIPMLRASVVEQRQSEAPHEGFEFVGPRQQLPGRPGQVFDLRMQLDYRPHVDPVNYPDYRNLLDFCVATLQAEVKTPSDDLDAAIARLQLKVVDAFPELARSSIVLKHVADVPGFAAPKLRAVG